MNTSKKTNLKRKKINTKYTKKVSNKNKKSSRNIFKILMYVILFFLIFCFILMLVLYNKILKDLPSVSELENYNLAQSSIIYDRNGKVLNNVFQEKRTYVNYESISKNMVNAIVAGEDKKFWTNPGVDVVGLIRAGLNSVTKGKKIGGTSTLTQQLIRNTIIEKKQNENLWEGIERKIKELYLSYRLTKDGISKEKILELYLNKIDFGHNSYGIEEASKTFFNKKASELNILESSILASLPKGPTFYSPYNRKDRLVGNAIIYDKNNEENKIEILTSKQIEDNPKAIQLLSEIFGNLKGSTKKGNDVIAMCGVKKENFSITFKVDNEGCVFLTYSELNVFLGSIKVKLDDKVVGYDIGRKDYILRRMLEDGYINFDEFKGAIIDSISLNFNKNRENMKAPHFVFYIREYLEEKYGKDALYTGGLKIYTSLDYDAQLKAEEIIEKQVEKNTKNYNAKNAGLISIDNETGEIIAMVGAVDYYNEDIKGNVNVITSKMQPGSIFKPFVYSLAMYKNEIGTKTPVYDLKTNFPGGYSPNNFDGKFMGKMNTSTALNHSRNIPAIKMYYKAGGTKSVVQFMKKLGVKSLDENGDYGASLALGSGEMTPLELAKAYTVFANMGKKVEINPILKIVDSRGNIIEEKKEVKKDDAITASQAFIINYVLSDTSTRPTYWNKYLSLSGRKVAAKTGTSTKPIKNKWGKRVEYPSNLWTAGYTPQVTTVAWAGNSDGETLNMSGNGLEGAGPIWKDFMEYIHKGKKASNWKKPGSVKNISISEITGYLPNPENANLKFLISSYFINIPKKTDNSYQNVVYDALCNGKVTDETPKEAIKEANILEFHSLEPKNPAWENPVLAWAKSEKAIEKYGKSSGILGGISDEPCKRPKDGGNILIGSDIESSKQYNPGNNEIRVAYESPENIKYIKVFLNGNEVKIFEINGKKRGIVNDKFFIPAMYRNQKIRLEVKAIDENYYSQSEIKEIQVVEKDTDTISDGINDFIDGNIIDKTDNDLPKIQITNPRNGNIKIYEDEYFNMRANIESKYTNKTEVYINSVLEKSFTDEKNIVLSINKENKYSIGTNNIRIIATNNNGGKSEKSITFEVLKR